MTAISTATREALDRAHALVQRDAALSDLVAALDPKRTQSLHTLAGHVLRMQETHARGLDRIEAGARPPRDGIEAALLILRRTGCPTSQRRLYDLLTDLLGN
ncbi:MAG: hypothetical protein R6V11_03640 [Ectothiorhodospiraceae bacterium]